MESKKLHTIILLIFATLLEHGSGNRQKYGGRVLNISPSECTSAKFPNVTGTCMISLECQQRSGTVIGACRDGVLFGACCHDANEKVAELPQTVPTTRMTTIKYESTTSTSKVLPVRNTISTLLSFKIQPEKNENKETNFNESSDLSVVTLEPPRVLNLGIPTKEPINNIQTSSQTNAPTTPHETIELEEALVSVTTESPLLSSPSNEDDRASINIGSFDKSRQESQEGQQNELDSRNVTEGSYQSTSTSTEPITTSTETVLNTSRLPVETTTTTATTVDVKTEPATSASTKFFYGKIKYSPKPMKFRPTTKKTVWTRPPTTETSYSIFATSEEEDDDEIRKPSRRRTTERLTTPTTISSDSTNSTNSTSEISQEISTPVNNSTEETTIPSTNQPSIEETPFVSTNRVATEETTAGYQKSTEEITSPYEELVAKSTLAIDKTTVTPTESPKPLTEVEVKGNQSILIPQKSVRIANPSISRRKGSANGEDSSDDDSTSEGWDNKLDDFVNQVVEGIAEELEKSNIDDVVFKSSTTSTTIKPTNKKTKTKAKPSKQSTKTTPSRRKPKPKGTPTGHQGSPKNKKSPTKKVTTSKNASSGAELLDYRKDCGVRPLARKSRIVGGTPSNYGSWPWHALVKETVWWGIFSKIKCGGVLIGARHVLTAAHCQPQQTGKLSVVLGVTDSDNPNANAVTKGVRRVIRHPEFNPKSYENDIAILELDSPVEFQPHIVPICMPDLKQVFEGSEGFVTGMGLLRHDGERPLVLHEVDVPILNNSDCRKMFRKSGNSKPIKESFICAGYPQGLKDSCGGDSGSYPNVPLRHYLSGEASINETVTEFFSGGPLSVRRSNGQWVLAGTVSHGIKCAVPNQPGVYMRTTWYRPWIEKVTRVSRGQDSPKCHGPPGSCDYRQTQSKGIFDTLFRVFRLARKFWKSRK